jgi:hypothetical protein
MVNMYYQPELNLKPEEVIDYSRKSQSDDPNMSVEEVLAKHEQLLDEMSIRLFGAKVPEQNKFREVVSGETLVDRPEIQKVLRLIESPKYKAIKCVEPQRLTRGDLEDIGRLMKLIKHTNTLVITQERTYDLRQEFDWEAFERRLKQGSEYLEYYKKIQARGRELSVAAGNYIASIPPYGYDKTTVMDGKKKCPTLKINPEQAEVVRMIFDMYVNQDLGRVTIAKRLNELGIKTMYGGLWAQDTIKGILENEHYIGKVKWNYRKTVVVVEEGEIRKTQPKAKIGEYLVYEGKHEAIISDELFRAAREKQGRNHRAKPSTKIRNPLAGLLFCQCGRAMSLRTYKKKGVERSAPRLLCDNQAYCGTSSCLYDEAIEKVVEVLKQCIADFEMRIQNNDGDSVKLHLSLIKRLEAKREELDKKELAQWEAQADPDPSKRMPEHIFKKLNEKLLAEKEEVRQALCKAYESMPEPVDYEEQKRRFEDALNALLDPEATAQRKNTLLKACIERIDYKREKAVRKKSQQVRYYDKDQKRTRNKSPLPTGGNWTTPPIELDVKLKVR